MPSSVLHEYYACLCCCGEVCILDLVVCSVRFLPLVGGERLSCVKMDSVHSVQKHCNASLSSLPSTGLCTACCTFCARLSPEAG